jgi:hypothetical protein
MKGLLEVFYRPGVLFASLPERKGAWIAPLIANCLLLLLTSFLVPHFMGRENIVRQQLESFHMSPEQTQAALTASNSPGRIYGGYAGAAVVAAVILLVISAALLVFAMMTSRVPRFASMFAMVSLAFFPYWLIATARTALILMTATEPAVLDMRNLIGTNPAAYMDKNSLAKGLYSLLSSLDVLSFLEIGLLSYGFAKLTRVSVFFGLAAVVGLWILYVSSKMALSLLF